MITAELQSKVKKLWETFWTGGITNPLTVIEQITYLMFIRMLDVRETLNEKKSQRTGNKDFNRIYPLNKQHLRWQKIKELPGDEMLIVMRDKVFPEFKNIGSGDSVLATYMKDAQFMVQKASLLTQAVEMVDKLPLTQGDTKGDLYELLLSELTTAGVNGQFRTPRHIIQKMVEMLDVKPTETVCDPACGTAGFLVGVMQYLQQKYSSPEGTMADADGNPHYTGDLLEPYAKHIQTNMFHGFDFDSTMLRIAAMNLVLHGVDDPKILYQDTLSGTFADRYPKLTKEAFDVVLANPPFKGSLDFEDVSNALLSKVKTKKTELLYVALILNLLKVGGRSATIVPDGVLFGSSNAHVALRKLLVEDNQLDAVISLPSGVFKPYAGVSTGILFFTKGGKTKDVFYYDVQADGYSLDDKRTPQPDKSDLPDLLNRWIKRDPKKDTDGTAKAFFVSADAIRKNDYDLSINRYKELVHVEVSYDPPKVILQKLMEMEREIQKDLEELGGMI